ncbi:MAG: MoaD/ThiS family protein [Nitrosomonadales bacterium]|nr:MoaD/ThiS family protein [Nitrosomonadales bacterium]
MIRVLFFGPVAERVGSSEIQVTFATGMRLQDLHRQMQGMYPAAFEIVCFTAMNGEHVRDMQLPVSDNSEVVFMSKFSGG